MNKIIIDNLEYYFQTERQKPRRKNRYLIEWQPTRLNDSLVGEPSHYEVLCNFYLCIPAFAVPLTSDHQSPDAPLRLANRSLPQAIG